MITGPPGCGKTTTIKILSKEHGIQVQEWVNPILPDFQKDDFKETFNRGKVYSEGNGNTRKSVLKGHLQQTPQPCP